MSGLHYAQLSSANCTLPSVSRKNIIPKLWITRVSNSSCHNSYTSTVHLKLDLQLSILDIGEHGLFDGMHQLYDFIFCTQVFNNGGIFEVET